MLCTFYKNQIKNEVQFLLMIISENVEAYNKKTCDNGNLLITFLILCVISTPHVFLPTLPAQHLE